MGEEAAELDDNDENPKPTATPKKQKGARDVRDLPPVDKMDAEDLVDAKLHVETAVHEKVGAMEKTQNDLVKLVEKVGEDEEDSEKLKQFDIDGELSKCKQCIEKMKFALRDVRSAKFNGFQDGQGDD